MRKVVIIFGLLVMSVIANGQSETLEKEKYAACRLIIPIDYKNLERDYVEAKKHEGVEIIIIRTSGKGKIKTIERGYVRNREKNGIKTVHFEPVESVQSPTVKIAKYPLFNDKNMYCYLAECFDSK